MPELIDFNGLPGLRFADAKMCAQGGQLLQFSDWLFLSGAAKYEFFQPIRGGIPIVFPYFGAKAGEPSAPQHGFARLSMWELSEDKPAATLGNEDLPDPQMWPPFEMRLEYKWTGALGVHLEVENLGEKPFDFEVMLHSYFAVSDVRTVQIEGLNGQNYRDKTDGGKIKTQNGALQLKAATDFVFENAGGPIAIRDAARTLQITPKRGWNSTVVWNPFKALGDVPENEWPKFVCVEAGSVGANKITLGAGQKYGLEIEIAMS